MSLRMRFLALAVAASALAIAAAPAFAQPKQPPKQPEQVAIKGTINEIRTQGAQVGINLTTSEGQSWWAVCNKNSKVRVVGTAKPDFLRSGLFVRFNTLADRKLGKLKDEHIAKMTLFTPSQEFQEGVFPDPTGKSDDPAYSVYDLAGKITSVKGTSVFLAVPGFPPKLRVELTDATQIDFNFGDVSSAKQGDTFEGRGTKMDLPPQAQMAQQRMQQGRQMQGRMMGQGAAAGRGGRGGVTPGLGGGFQGPGAPAGAQAGAQAGAGQAGAGAAAAATVAGDTKPPSFCTIAEGKVTKAEPLSGGAPMKGRTAASSRTRKEKTEPAETPAKKE